MSIKPTFSIIIPVYNSKDYLIECINSILCQSINDFEILLIDDGSYDGSSRICDLFAQRDIRIRTFHKENGGQLHSRLYGLSLAKGDYCVYVDSDDYLVNDALYQLKTIISRTGCDCIVYGLQSVSNNKVINTYNVDHDFFSSNKDEIYRTCFSGSEYNSVCRKAFRRSIWSDVDLSAYYYLRHGEDLLQSMEILKNCRNVYFLSKVLYNYRINYNSVTHTTSKQQCIDFTVSEKALDFLMNEAVFSNHDFDMYRRVRIEEFLLPTIKRISGASTTLKEKKEAFNVIRQSKYYKEFLAKRIVNSCDGIVNGCIYLLFKCRLDRLLIVLFRMMQKTKHSLIRRNRYKSE